ncbi:MAG: Gfo/Idh/MocA family oxidoreductase [Halanaerobiales bacterium]
MAKLKVGVVGVGSMGKNHVRAYASLKHVCELIGVFDINQGMAEEVARSYGVKAFSTLEALLAEVDAINIATPTSTHYEIGMKALEAGKHILMEKPVTGSVEEAQTLIRNARKKSLIFQVGHIERFNPVIRHLPNILKDQEIIAIDVQRLGPYDPRIDDTDVIQDLMIHDIDVVNSLIPAPIARIQAFGRRLVSARHIDYAVANLMMENGVIANLTASRVTNKKVRKMEITTVSSFIELDYLQKKITMTAREPFIPGTSNYNQEQVVEEVYNGEEEPLKLQLLHFINCIEDNTRPLISGADGLEALKVTRIIQELVYREEEAAELPVSG